jgi:MvaI/BcnI restriction endonuclease family
MFSSADAELVVEVSTHLTGLGLETAFLVPTPTGLSKSIMDATGPIRAYLKSHKIHDYDLQGQGGDHKVVLPAVLVGASSNTETQASLYRPNTKSGDPRIWFSKLPTYASAGDLLALLTNGHQLFVVNASRSSVWKSRHASGSPLANLLESLSSRASDAAEELLSKLRDIAAMGYVPSVRSGATGVGGTLEHLLGIKTNSSKKPDYRGIEIKAARRFSGSKANRVNLFSQVPDWNSSNCKNGKQLISTCGYPRSAPASLYCTVAERPNSQGLYFSVDESTDVLHSMLRAPAGHPRAICQWELELLRGRLAEKHSETFWVKAAARKDSEGKEHFHYVEVEHTRAPVTSALAPLVKSGVVTMDFTLKLKPTGGTRDHGYLFKIRPENLDALFPPSRRYRLI